MRDGTASASSVQLSAFSSLVRWVALTGLAGVVSGAVVGGVGGRVAMRVSALAAGSRMVGAVTENGNRIGEVSLGGTVGLVIFGGILTGAIGAVLIVIAEPWLAWMGRWRGLGFGVFLFAVLGDEVIDGSNLDFILLQPAVLNVAMFSALFFAFGLMVPVIRGVLDRRLPPAGNEPDVGYLVIAALGAPFVLMGVLAFTSPDFCGCDPAYGLGILLLLLGFTTAATWFTTISGGGATWLPLVARAVGYGSLMLLVGFGLWRVLTQIKLIL